MTVLKKIFVYFLILTFAPSWFSFYSPPIVFSQEATPSAENIATESAQIVLPQLVLGLEVTNSAQNVATESSSLDSIEITLDFQEVMASAQLESQGAAPSAKEKSKLMKELKDQGLLKINSDKKNFQAKDSIMVDLAGYDMSGLSVLVTDPSGEELGVGTSFENGQLVIEAPTELIPGKYRLKLLDDENQPILEQDFTWGVLAINTNKSIYLPEEKAELAMAVLDEQGRMVCDAKLELRITNKELGINETLSTENGKIKVNPECQMHSYTEKPDYEASYRTEAVGTYQMELLAETQNGSFTINDSFEVRERVDFDIERTGPTRIYPPAIYSVSFDVMANQDFEGVVEETVPSSFEILPLEEEEEVLGETTLAEIVAEVENNTLTSYQRSYDKVKEQEKTKVISWYVSVKKGEKINLGYRFDAPDISPQFYLLGPLKFINVEGQVVFQETRQWQIASDLACVSAASGDWNVEATWTGCGASGPVAGDAVSIGAHTITVTADAAATSVTFTAAASGVLTVNTGVTLTLSGGITLNSQAAANSAATISGAGSISTASVTSGTDATVSSNTTWTTTLTSSITSLSLSGDLTIASYVGVNVSRKGNATFTLSGGATTVGGSVATTNENAVNISTFTMSNSTLNLSGATPFSLSATGTSTITLDGAGAMVNYNSSSAQTVRGTTYTTLKINNTNASGATLGAATTVTTLTIGDVASSIFNDEGFQLTSTGTLNLTAGTFKLGSAGTATTWPAFATHNITAGTTVEYAAGVAQTVSITPSYSNLTFSGAGTKTPDTGTLAVGGNWTASSPVALNTNNNIVNITGNLAGTGSITQGTGLITLAGDWTNTGTFAANAVGVTLTGTGKQITGPAGGITFTTLTVNGTYTNNNTGTITISTALSGSSTLTQGTSSTLAIGGTSGITGLDASTNTNTVNYTGTGQTIKDVTYSDLTISGSISTGINTATVGGTFNVSGTFTPSGGTITMTTTSWAITNSGTLIFSGLTIAETPSVSGQPASSFSVSGALTVNLGKTLAPTAGTITMTGGSIVNNGGATTNLVFNNLMVTGTTTTSSDFSTNGTLNVSGGNLSPSAGTITMSGASGSIANSGTLAFNNLSVGSGATATTSNSFNINSNFSNSGVFTASAGTVTFSGGDGSAQQISGDSSFYNFTASTASNTTGRTLQFAGSSSVGIGGTWAVTGASGKVITLQSSDINNWTINPTATSVTYVDVYYSTNTGTSFCATYSTKDVNTVGWNVSTGGSCNEAPNSPTALVQKKTTDATLSTGDWTNETSVKFTATATDPDSSDTLYLCVEKDQLGTGFSNTEDLCGSGVGYSGGSVEVTVTITSITDDQEYHWQARLKDAASAYSSWVSYDVNGEAERDFGVDTSAPTGGTVYDGAETGVDKDLNSGSLSELSANWSGVDGSVAGISEYEYSVGTTIGGTDIKTWTSVGVGTSATSAGLTLQTSAPYYFNVRATDNATNVQTEISSDGQIVTPSLSFSVSPGSLTFANLNAGNSFTDTKNTTLTTSTNAYGGYVIRAHITDLLTATTNPSYTISNFDGGTYALPDEWLAGDRGFGYNSSDTTIQGGNKFNSSPCDGGGNPPCYAPFSLTGPGDIVADHTTNVTGTPITDEAFTITNKAKVNTIQEAFPYATTIIYTATAYY